MTAAGAELKPQLVHTAREMLEARAAKYNDPQNLEWDWDDITNKWERHALNAVLDLQAVETERDSLITENKVLREALQDAVSTVGTARTGSIGSIDNVYLPQIDVAQVKRWRAALGEKE